MSYVVVLWAGLPVALLGVIEQVWFLVLSVGDYRYAKALVEARRSRHLILARIVSSVTLALVHVLVVASISLVLSTLSDSRAVNPSATALQLAYARVAVSTLVVISTTGQLVARWYTQRHR